MQKLKSVLLSILTLFILTGISFAQEKETSTGDAGWENGILKFKSADGKFMTRFDVVCTLTEHIFLRIKMK